MNSFVGNSASTETLVLDVKTNVENNLLAYNQLTGAPTWTILVALYGMHTE